MMALLDGIDFIPPRYRAQVMWRTASSKDTLTPESKPVFPPAGLSLLLFQNFAVAVCWVPFS